MFFFGNKLQQKIRKIRDRTVVKRKFYFSPSKLQKVPQRMFVFEQISLFKYSKFITIMGIFQSFHFTKGVKFWKNSIELYELFNDQNSTF